MKSPTLGNRSVRIEVGFGAPSSWLSPYCVPFLCALTVLFACQSNSSSSDALSAASTTAVTTTLVATAQPEVSAEVIAVAPQASNVAAIDATTSVETKPSDASTKTPRPKSSSATPPSDAPKPVASAAAPAPAAEGEAPAIDKPCLAKSFEFSAVKSACETGGVPKAKALMKTWTKKAKEKGEDYKCTSCHDNQRTYSNSSNASADLRKLLNVIK